MTVPLDTPCGPCRSPGTRPRPPYPGQEVLVGAGVVDGLEGARRAVGAAVQVLVEAQQPLLLLLAGVRGLDFRAGGGGVGFKGGTLTACSADLGTPTPGRGDSPRVLPSEGPPRTGQRLPTTRRLPRKGWAHPD